MFEFRLADAENSSQLLNKNNWVAIDLNHSILSSHYKLLQSRNCLQNYIDMGLDLPLLKKELYRIL